MNEFVDAMRVYRLSTTEWSIVMHIIRKTWGDKGRAWKVIPWSDFMKKCRMSKGSVSNSLNRLFDRNFVHTKKIESKTAYKINSKPSTWKPAEPYKPPKKKTAKSVQELEVKSVQELGLKVFKNLNKSVQELEVNQNSTYILKDNIKRQGKDTPIIPIGKKAGNGAQTKGKIMTKKQMMEQDARTVVDFINEISGKSFKHSETSLAPIRGRLREGYTLHQCLQVCHNKWFDPNHDEKYFRPITLFRPSLFESYLNEKGSKHKPTKRETQMQATMEVFARRHHERSNPPGGGR